MIGYDCPFRVASSEADNAMCPSMCCLLPWRLQIVKYLQASANPQLETPTPNNSKARPLDLILLTLLTTSTPAKPHLLRLILDLRLLLFLLTKP